VRARHLSNNHFTSVIFFLTHHLFFLSMVNSQPTQGASAVDGGTRAPEKFSCPFRYRATKHNLSYPDFEPCKEGKQFPNISKLRYVHIPNLEIRP
jgi:hypothetical protein